MTYLCAAYGHGQVKTVNSQFGQKGAMILSVRDKWEINIPGTDAYKYYKYW